MVFLSFSDCCKENFKLKLVFLLCSLICAPSLRLHSSHAILSSFLHTQRLGRTVRPLQPEEKPVQLPRVEDGQQGLLVQALLAGNFNAAIDLSLANDNLDDALLLAIAAG